MRPGDDPEELKEAVERKIAGETCGLPPEEIARLAGIARDRLLSPLNILTPFVKDPAVQEIMVNGPDHIFIETGEGIRETGQRFSSEEELEEVIRRIAADVRRDINELNPILDARLPDGSRVNAVYKNITAEGPVLTIRKFAKQRITMEDLTKNGTVTEACARYLRSLVRFGCSLFISGGTSSGKTTFLNALTDAIPKDARVIVIEDSRELSLGHIRNLVQLECHNANLTGKGEIGMDRLIRTSLRMRPDRIIVGEVRGEEAQDMLQAMNTGHDAMCTGHANSVLGMLRRLEAMCLMRRNMPVEAVRQQIVEAVDVMVHLRRFPDGRRRVTEVQELSGLTDGGYDLNPLFLLDNGHLVRTGAPLRNAKFREFREEE